jgi:DNA-binding IclR family transcriptional regulator
MESTSIVKALGLLEATSSEPNGRLLSALAAEVGLSKPTAHRILKTLTTLGYIQRAPGGVYRQTPKVQRLVSNEGTQRLVVLADPYLRELHERTLETVNLGVLRHDRVSYLRVLESPQPLRRVATPNSVDPFHSTALGRAIAAFLPDDVRAALLESARMERSTPRTNTSRRALADILTKVASDGYALEVDETDLGVTCIGAAVLAEGSPCAAISLSIPTARATSDQLPSLIKLVRATAQDVGKSLDGNTRGKPPTK